MKQTIIDANYILRWFLNDVPEQAQKAEKLIKSGRPGQIIVDRVTIAEITYVLRAQGYDHQQIFTLFQELYYYPSMIVPTESDWRSLELFNQTTLDFEDCLLLARHQIERVHMATFDKGLQKLLGQ